MITEFTCRIAQQDIDDLKLRISQTRWTDEIKDSGWLYGASLFYMKELADYWLNKFEWRKVEEDMNQYPNYIAEIDGIKIHFMHIKGRGKISLPLIITHGWPGSFLEMSKLIELCAKQATTMPIKKTLRRIFFFIKLIMFILNK